MALSGLVERASKNREATFLSELELQALRMLIGQGDAWSDLGKNAVAAPEEPIPTKIGPTVKWLPKVLSKNQTRICIDFGTSFSKAFACEGNDPLEAPKLIDIVLTQEAEGSARYLLPPELFIHEGKVYFGISARRRSSEVVLLFRPVSSQIKMDQGFI